jgi:hypothetical protein
MRKVRPVKLRYRKLNGLRLRLIAERITGKPEVIEQAWLVRVIGNLLYEDFSGYRVNGLGHLNSVARSGPLEWPGVSFCP